MQVEVRKPRRVWRLAPWALAVVAIVGVVELIAVLGLIATGTYPQKTFRDMYATSACLKGDEFNYGKHAANRQDVEVMLGRIPHPFFGFVVNPGNTDLEWRRRSVGPNYENELRYRVSLGRDPRPDDTFTIGIFGASVAVSFAQHVQEDDRFADALRERIPALRNRRIVIRNMAIGASRQPAQLAIATHYMELFDMTINLDGYSEQAIVMYPEYPIEYPMFGDVFFNTSGSSAYLTLRAAATACAWISRPGRLPLIGRSNAYYLFWYVSSASLKRSFDQGGRAVPDVVETFPFNAEDIRRLYAAYYERYTRYQSQLLSDNGVRAYFFLQPNQYVPGSKPFSDEERRTALNMAESEETAERYALLKEKVRDLSAGGIRAFDLTGVFSNVSDTVYVDSCCHVNALGNGVIANAIVESIASVENADASPR